ncbi:MAG TPA: glycosyltransferase family 2 protein [Candidatus Sulfotelmatobacter sp.]|jgi:glycosyltransferase involved in cell wall biosynthesis
MNLSVVIITYNEEANLARTLASVKPLVADGKGEIIVVDSGSTDRTVEIAKSFGAKVFIEEWKGYAAQKNSAIDKATGDWILSLDADEEISEEMRKLLPLILFPPPGKGYAGMGLRFARRNYFLGRWIRHGGFWPDVKLRMFWRGLGRFEDRTVHEDISLKPGCDVVAPSQEFDVGSSVAIIHHSYPTLYDYIEHMNHYSSLGAEMVAAKGKDKVRFSVTNIVLRPLLTFVYNYFFRLGFLDGREGLLLHLYHAVYVSWKYAKAWELSRSQNKLSS